jgi:hypothetical protein
MLGTRIHARSAAQEAFLAAAGLNTVTSAAFADTTLTNKAKRILGTKNRAHNLAVVMRQNLGVRGGFEIQIFCKTA